MIGISVVVKSDRASQAISALEEPVRKEVFDGIGLLLISRAKDNIANRSGPGGAWPRTPFTELYAGPRLWRDISRSLVSESNASGVRVGSTHIAAAVRQLGTVGAGGSMPDIVPVKKKALTIPVSEKSSRASYQGIPAREAFPDAFVLTRDGKHGASPAFVGVIARKVGGRTNKKTGVKTGQRLEELYLLVKRVAIRPHPFLPIDRSGELQPASLWTEIETLIIDNFAKRVA